MTNLEIDVGGGQRRTVELDRRQPLSIGRHATNDIRILGEDVEPMHCRISWNKGAGYEVHAASSEGVDVNGTLVNRAPLESGDVLRIGAANVIFRDQDPATREDAAGDAPQREDGAYALKPLSSEIDFPLPLPAEEGPPAEHAADDDAPLTADEILADDDRPLTADEILPDDSAERRRRRKEKRRRLRKGDGDRHRGRKSARSASEPAGDADADQLDDAGNSPGRPDIVDAGAVERLRERLRARAQRPGERDSVRSPLVLSLGGGALVLVLAGATFYFILGRQSTQAQFDAAQSLMDEGKYAQAIHAFEDFLALYPRDSLADEAQVQMWMARIEQQAGGASPNWPQALRELQGFINARRDADGFENLHEVIRKRAESIALGAATSAGKAHDRELLSMSQEASNLLKSYAPRDAAPGDALRRIESVRRSSEAAILKHEAFTGAVAAIDAALRTPDAMVALATRRQLLARYPDFADDAALAAKLSEILTTEQSLAARSDQVVGALTDDDALPSPAALTLVFHARSRTDEVSVGRTVIGLAKDCCYALDSITGEPVWRRAIGWETPFFPIAVPAGDPELLLYDTAFDELVLLDQQTGELRWRQPEVTGVRGAPLIDEGQVYLATASGSVAKVDLESGRVISRLQFSQPVSSPVALNDGSRLAVCGEQEVVYTLTKRPLECLAVSYLGHPAGSVAAPLLAMGALLLVVENRPGEVALVHVLDSRSPSDRLEEAARRTIPGQVVDAPVIRGRDLFVPSSGGRVNAFSVSDERGQPPLTEGPRYEAEGSGHGPQFLATGPDRQLWMAGRDLRKLQLTADAIQSGRQVVPLGRATQPLQQSGKQVFVGRSPPFSSAVTFLQIDRENLAAQWQTVLGARLISLATLPDGDALVAVSEAGDVFRASHSQIAEGGFVTGTSARLRLPEGLASPLQATTIADGKTIAWCDDPQPELWIINRLGQIERRHSLPAALEAAPVLVGSRLALPLPGRVHLLRDDASQPLVQDFALPLGESPPSRWRQLVAVDEASLIAVDESGRLRLLRLKDAAQPYLAEEGDLDVGGPIEFDVAFSEGRIAVASGRQLTVVAASALEPVAETQLDHAVSCGPWLSGERLFVETGRSALHCFETVPELTRQWSIPLPGGSLSGAPLVDDDRGAVIISLLDGTLLYVNAESGEVLAENHIRQSLSGGPSRVGSDLVVATEDGSLVPIRFVLDGQ